MPKICKPYGKCNINHISQPFGVNPTSYQLNGHTGVDFSPPFLAFGTNLVAPEDVRIKRVITQETFDPVRFIENMSKGFGVLMTSLENPEVDYLYWHCINPLPINEGQIVKQGELVAQMGNSGFVMQFGQLVPIEHRSRPGNPGTHLHFEKRVDNVYVNPIPDIDWSILVQITTIQWLLEILRRNINLLKTFK